LDNTSGAGGTIQIVLSSKAAGVGGTVNNDKNEAIGGAVVTLWPKISNLGDYYGGVKQVYTDQNGAFRFAASIKLGENGHATLDPKLMSRERIAVEVAKLP
jgi:hypothetical protein